MSGLVESLTNSVARLYEAYPYPRYPLLAKPRWQEGYLTASNFAARVAAGAAGETADSDAPAVRGRAEVLIGGAGEILPYVIRRWEPRQHRVTCLDLSGQSLRRARFRMFPILSPTAFVRGDLANFLQASPEKYQHIDAYGVIHHMPNPRAALGALASALAPGGTARLMLYNSRARTWIRELARAFADIGLDPFARQDLKDLRHLLRALAISSPPLANRLSQLGQKTLSNDARLVDTFLHPREARISIEEWFATLAAAGLSVRGIFDRYAELDDLRNPLWVAPNAAELTARAADRRFENNLELFVAKAGVPRAVQGENFAARFSMPPRAWFSYDETRAIPLALKFKLWHAHLAFVAKGQVMGTPRWVKSLSVISMARLARLGVVLPGMLGDSGREQALVAPLAIAVEPPSERQPLDLRAAGLGGVVGEVLKKRGRDSERRREAILTRFDRAQY